MQKFASLIFAALVAAVIMLTLLQMRWIYDTDTHAPPHQMETGHPKSVPGDELAKPEKVGFGNWDFW